MELINYDKPNLPVALDDLAKFVLVGREKLTMVRAGIRAMDKLDMAEGVRKQKKEEAQMLAEALLDAEVRIGEILAGMPKASGGDRKSESAKIKIDTGVDFDTTPTKQEAIKELGFDQKQAERFQTLAANTDLVEQVKEEARKSEDLPTRAAESQYKTTPAWIHRAQSTCPAPKRHTTCLRLIWVRNVLKVRTLEK
jgi:hypothetical protein